MPVSTRTKHKSEADNLFSAVFDYFITTKTLSAFLDDPKDLCHLSITARSFLPFRCQLRTLVIHTGGLTEGLLRHMHSGGFSDVTSIVFVNRRGSFSRPSPLPEELRCLLCSASRRLSSLTWLELWSDGFAIELLQDFDPAVRVQLQDLHLDPGHGSEAIMKSLLQGSPNLQALALINVGDNNHLTECLTHAFKVCKSLRKLDLYLTYFDDDNLPTVLAPILDGQAPNLKELSLRANLWDDRIDILVRCFPFLSVFDLRFNFFSRRGKARIRQAAEKHPTLTLWLPDDEEDSDTEEDEDEEDIGEGNDEGQEDEEGSDDEVEGSNDTEEEDD